jgi:hypothetical protein
MPLRLAGLSTLYVYTTSTYGNRAAEAEQAETSSTPLRSGKKLMPIPIRTF